MNHYTVYIFDQQKYAHIKMVRVGYLGEHNKPAFSAASFVVQSMFRIEHFHCCLN